MKTSVIILNWNGKKWLEKFLPSVIERTRKALIVVADNGSTDDSKNYMCLHHPEVVFIEIGQNLGYSGGYNRALRIVKEKYPHLQFSVLLNSDVEPQEGWLDPLEKRMEKEASLGAIQPKILDFHKPNNFEYAGAAGGLLDKWGYPFARGRVFDDTEEDKGQYDSPEFSKIFWASGACLMIRVSAFFESGLLDERLFAHMEEIDLCWRMNLRGYDIECCTSSSVFHVGGGTLGAISPQKTYLNFRNSLLIIVKNAPTIVALRIISGRLFFDAAAGALFLFRRQPQHLISVIKAHFSFYKMFSEFAFSPSNQKKSWPKHGLYNGSVVWNYFIRKKENINL